MLETIGMVRAAGGVCVFAHPRRRGRHVDDDGIAELAAAGLHGIEVDHPDHDQQARLERRQAKDKAEDAELIKKNFAAVRQALAPIYLAQVAARYELAIRSEESFRERQTSHRLPHLLQRWRTK